MRDGHDRGSHRGNGDRGGAVRHRRGAWCRIGPHITRTRACWRAITWSAHVDDDGRRQEQGHLTIDGAVGRRLRRRHRQWRSPVATDGGSPVVRRRHAPRQPGDERQRLGERRSCHTRNDTTTRRRPTTTTTTTTTDHTAAMRGLHAQHERHRPDDDDGSRPRSTSTSSTLPDDTTTTTSTTVVGQEGPTSTVDQSSGAATTTVPVGRHCPRRAATVRPVWS